VVLSKPSRCGRWVSWHLSPTSPVNVPSTCALGLESCPPARTEPVGILDGPLYE